MTNNAVKNRSQPGDMGCKIRNTSGLDLLVRLAARAGLNPKLKLVA
jgi:hypothetical protein